MLVIIIAVLAAAMCGYVVYQDNKTMKWFDFPILAVGGHGLMLVGMAAHFAFPHVLGHGFMQGLVVALAVPLFMHVPGMVLGQLRANKE